MLSRRALSRAVFTIGKKNDEKSSESNFSQISVPREREGRGRGLRGFFGGGETLSNSTKQIVAGHESGQSVVWRRMAEERCDWPSDPGELLRNANYMATRGRKREDRHAASGRRANGSREKTEPAFSNQTAGKMRNAILRNLRLHTKNILLLRSNSIAQHAHHRPIAID